VEFSVGQIVVYGGHGVGRVVARETKAAALAFQEVVVVELAATLTVTLPVELAQEELRAVVNESELAGVRKTLRAAPPTMDSVWVRRQKATRAKLVSGQAVCLAEVVSDGAHRFHGEAPRLSSEERQLYLKARKLLADEIGHARGIGAEEAEEWITDQLTHAPAWGSPQNGKPPESDGPNRRTHQAAALSASQRR
jgi:RNA polymerase-interacting CarD/CdnL/TRCF family regulator